MAAEGRDCPDILLQIAAVRKALDNTAKVIFADHIENCLVDSFHHSYLNPQNINTYNTNAHIPKAELYFGLFVSPARAIFLFYRFRKNLLY